MRRGVELSGGLVMVVECVGLRACLLEDDTRGYSLTERTTWVDVGSCTGMDIG